MALTAGQLEVGATLPLVTKKITLEMSKTLWSLRPSNFHTSKEEAQKLGFRDAVIAGPHITSIVCEALTQALGEGFMVGGKININFIGNVFADDTVAVTGTVTEKTPEGNKTRVYLSISCENQEGTKTGVGSASGLVATA